MARTYREPTEEERAALESFALAHGRRWRSELTDVYWYNARLWRGPNGDDPVIGSVLHGVRNDLGPEWLHQVYKPPVKQKS